MVSFCLVFRGSDSNFTLQSHWHVLNENLPKIEPIHLSGTIVSIKCTLKIVQFGTCKPMQSDCMYMKGCTFICLNHTHMMRLLTSPVESGGRVLLGHCSPVEYCVPKIVILRCIIRRDTILPSPSTLGTRIYPSEKPQHKRKKSECC